jgi:hypothetical protein
MASTEFKVVSWSPHDPITNNKMNAMVSNDNWLRDNMVRGRYSANGVDRDLGIRIVGGLALITAVQRPRNSRRVSFGNYFSASCRPIVTTGIVSAQQRMLHVVIEGPGSELQPNRNGFTAKVFANVANPKNKRQIKRNIYISYIALGY